MRATCTWGEGPDVLVVIEGTHVILYEDPKHHKPPRGDWKHGYITDGSFDLTVDEAEKLAHELLLAAKAARDLLESYCKYAEELKDESIKDSNRVGEGEKTR